MHGVLNSYLVNENYVLTKDKSQIVTGTKTFDNFLTYEKPTVMKNLRLKGLLNGIDIDELMKRQVRKKI